jgi:hypothetical protein
MAETRRRPASSDDAFIILAQIFGAFGHGAGGLTVEKAVVRRASKDYTKVIQVNARKWEALETSVLEAARMTGRLAAHRALNGGRIRINVPDYLAARRTVVLFCPFMHPHPRELRYD